MLIVLFIVAAFNDVFGSPVPSSIDTPDKFPLTILDREISLPECINPAGYRTMQQIILSCLVTVFACTWISLHPNVPDPRNSGWENFSMRLRTFLWAVLGPEFVTIWAFRQHLGALRNAKEYNEKFKLTPRSRSKFQYLLDWFHRPNEELTPDREPWSLTHGFLLEMHGLRYFKNGQPFTPSHDKSRGEKRVSKRARQVLADAHKGIVIHLSQLSQRADISEGEINDKSKGDFFTKLVVVIQTTWFIVQCVARWVQHLHVTELEIITLAFAILNIITYILWWNKPQNMRIAIPIHDERNNSEPTFAEKKDIAQCRNSNEQEITELADNHSLSEQATLVAHSSSTEQLLPPDDQKLPNHQSPSSHSFSLLKVTVLTPSRFCWTCVRKISPLRAWSIMLGADNPELGSSDVIPVFYSSVAGYSEEDRKSDAFLCLVGILFGGVHLLPVWMSLFTTPAEKYLWIACTIVILVEPVIICLTDVIFSLKNRVPRWFHILFYFSTAPFFLLGFFLYAPARLILIVLAFQSLRSLPPDTFVNVKWSTFFPHI
ncbi:hypothetical protein NP233_g10343 [Leucocoprinus birnbaumii]|uniref:Uncharacterized protein n=1 Tax=Leucocoprinus birnbaumii TaxID=56174 RepID=A0AAD5VIR1_9AGAR|nr:hypothetical protein NP233_g10343 [Leucocoprinus birnbaumii]